MKHKEKCKPSHEFQQSISLSPPLLQVGKSKTKDAPDSPLSPWQESIMLQHHHLLSSHPVSQEAAQTQTHKPGSVCGTRVLPPGATEPCFLHTEEPPPTILGNSAVFFTETQRWRTWHSSILFSPEPYLDRVNICVIVTFTLSETFTNKSTNAALRKGTALLGAGDRCQSQERQLLFLDLFLEAQLLKMCETKTDEKRDPVLPTLPSPP